MFNIKRIESWREGFGLFPISIKPTTPNKYALLNGGVKDFCVDLAPDGNVDLFNSYAWSANTKNYLTVDDEHVKIYNWLKPESRPEEIKIDVVQEHIEKFYKYLGHQTYRTENDVVPFVSSLFHKMRNITREGTSPKDALSLLFTLLMSIDEDVEHLDYQKWEINEVELPWGFKTFIDELKRGVGPAKPDLGIILRHCSGPIFQEAHDVVQKFYPYRNLFGEVSGKVVSSSQAYSSTHYTPQYVARSIVEQCIKRLDLKKNCVKIFDPACGSGEFLMEVLKQLYAKKYAGEIVIRGWDCSDCAVITSKFLLNYEKETVWQDRLSLDIRLVQDSLQEEWSKDNDIILMNPPFVSWDIMDKEQRAVVSECFPFNAKKPNQAVAFLQKAIDVLQQNGVLGCVMPSLLFNSDAYKPLLLQMENELSSCLVGKLGNFIFEDAMADVGVYVCQKPKNLVETTLLWCKNERGVAQNALCALRKLETGNWREQRDTNKYSVYISDSYPYKRDSWKVVSYEDDKLRRALDDRLCNGVLVETQTLFTIKQGVRTGANKTFVIDEEEYKTLSEKEKGFYRKSIDNEAITLSKLEPKHYIWYPYNKSGLTITDEEQLKGEAPITYERLLKDKTKLEERKSLANKSCWWALSRHRGALLKKGSCLVSTEFGNSRSYSFDKNGDCIVERGYVWSLKKGSKADDYYFYLAIFSSPLFEKLLSIYAKQLAGGNWYDLAPKYTNKIPIPDVSNHRGMDTCAKLITLGKSITATGSGLYLMQNYDLLCELYGLNNGF